MSESPTLIRQTAKLQPIHTAEVIKGEAIKLESKQTPEIMKIDSIIQPKEENEAKKEPVKKESKQNVFSENKINAR